jgi:hypothetical protein
MWIAPGLEGSSQERGLTMPSSWFRNLGSSQAAGATGITRNSHPMVELLEERCLLTTNTGFVTQLYSDLLHRAPDAAGLQGFVNALDTGTVDRAQVVQIFLTSPEGRVDEVNDLFTRFLGRTNTDSSLNDFVSFLNNGGTEPQIAATILGSNEYFQTKGGGTNDGFLAALYTDVLHRPIDAVGAAAWGQALASGTSRQAVATAILNSPEGLQNQVNDLYTRFLGRAADPSGLAFWESQLNTTGNNGSNTGDNTSNTGSNTTNTGSNTTNTGSNTTNTGSNGGNTGSNGTGQLNNFEQVETGIIASTEYFNRIPT